VLLGASTYVRVIQTGIEDLACAHAIERIRRRYGELHPDYLAVMKRPHSEPGVHERTRWQLFFTAATVVASVTSVLAGAVAGLALGYAGERLAVSTAAAIPIGIVVLAIFMRDQRRRWARAAEALL
jgi:hypothetical protein